jgi:hypothetical protein
MGVAMTKWLVALALTLVVGTSVAPPPVDAAVGSGAVTWTVDHKKRTVTVAAHLQIYLGPCIPYTEAPGGAEGGPGSTGTDCTTTEALIAQAIKYDAEGVWNGHYYRCYRLTFNVDVTVTTDRFHVDPNRVGVRIDRSVDPIRSWVEPTLGSKIQVLTTNNWQSNDPSDRAEADNGIINPTTWAYPRVNAHEYAHEFGHVLGLDDQYVESTQLPQPGAPTDVMSSAQSSFVDQSTVDRVVERNRDRLKDTNGQAVDLADFKCERQFRATFIAGERDYQASNIMDSLAAAPCSRAPETNSTSQELRVDSQPVDLYVHEDENAGPLGYQLIPQFDVLTLQNGLNGGGRITALAGLFDMPISVRVGRFNSTPAAGEVPDVYDIASGACSGGGESGPPADCGNRTYDSWLQMSQSGADELWPNPSSLPAYLQSIGYSEARLESLYLNCSGPSPWPGNFSTDGGAVVTHGKLPSLEALNKVADDWVQDEKPGSIEIDGSATLNVNGAGNLTNNSYNWTLTLCPLNSDGETPPNCP